MNNVEHESVTEHRTESTDDECSVDTDANESKQNPESEDDFDGSHLDDVDDGCGCTEIWEHLSEQRGE